MKMKDRKRLWTILLSLLLVSAGSLGISDASPPCCSDDPEVSYLLSPRPSQKFQYQVRYESFFSKSLGKEKSFFIILPENFYQHPGFKYPVLFLLHGYNFHRRGAWWKVGSPEKAMKILCEEKEEEYHWLLHEDIALIAYAMMDWKNRTYQTLQRDLEVRFGELAENGGLGKGDYSPKEIAQSIVFHNLHPGGNSSDPFHPLMKMIIVLPDGDNGFYTDENEGKRLFPETKESKPCDRFQPGEAFRYSLLPFFLMKPGALGRHESYFLEILHTVENLSPYRDRILQVRGLGGISMGGFGAVKLGLKHPRLFHSVSSQSGLLDIDLLRDKWMLKMIMPEFLEVFGRLEAQKFPSASFLDKNTILTNNPLSLFQAKRIFQPPSWLYFDYGEKEGFRGITGGNQNVEKALNEKLGSHQISAQPYNGKAAHNNLFWRSRSGNILKYHSDVFRKAIRE